jgi:plastocyanin
MQGSAFNPTTRTVVAGTAVTWLNKDGLQHTVTSSAVPAGATAFNTTINPAGSLTLVFNAPGTYQYFCTIHGTAGSGMRATLIVN